MVLVVFIAVGVPLKHLIQHPGKDDVLHFVDEKLQLMPKGQSGAQPQHLLGVS